MDNMPMPSFGLGICQIPRNSLCSLRYWTIAPKKVFCTLLVLVLAMAACAGDPGSNVVFFDQSSVPKYQPAEILSVVTTNAEHATVTEYVAKANNEASTAELAPVGTIKKPGKPSFAATAMEALPVTRSGSAAYYIPKEMIQERASLVDLWIDRTTTIAQLKQELAAKLQVTADKINIRNVRDRPKLSGTPTFEKIDGETIPIGDTMIAQLRGGDDFTIDPKEPVTQSLKNENRGKWNWRVTPKHESKTGIYLDLDIWIDPGPGKRLIDSYHESVIVKARARTCYEIAQDINQWLLLLGIGGVSGLITVIVTWYRKRKQRIV